jgi:NAD(P)-dependent dehydrogenase (short-subunit alcohol dehydrogenase family)
MSAWVLVTGGASPLTTAAAMAAGARGYSIALHHAPDDAGAIGACEDLRARHINALPIAADLNDEESIGTLAARACDAAGASMSHLVFATTLLAHDSVETFTAAHFERHMRANVLAPALLAQAFAAALPSDGHGSIVLLIDAALNYPDEGLFTYTSAVEALAKSADVMARALAPRVRVNVIAQSPRAFIAARTDLTDPLTMRTPPTWAPINIEAMEEALAFLLESPAITGQTLFLEARPA